MNPQADNTPGLGLPQPSNDMGQLPPIHAPETFHAPENAAPQFDISTSPMPAAPPVAVTPAAMPMQPAAGAIVAQPMNTGLASTPDPLVAMNAQFDSNNAAVQEDADTPFDEEWVVKAKDIVGRTHTDPFTQSKELSKLKAQYIKARYNKDIKVSD